MSNIQFLLHESHFKENFSAQNSSNPFSIPNTNIFHTKIWLLPLIKHPTTTPYTATTHQSHHIIELLPKLLHYQFYDSSRTPERRRGREFIANRSHLAAWKIRLIDQALFLFCQIFVGGFQARASNRTLFKTIWKLTHCFSIFVTFFSSFNESHEVDDRRLIFFKIVWCAFI